jgi:hypothetical protein
VYRLVEGLAEQGWRVRSIPSTGQLLRNRQLLHLRTPDSESRYRLLIYKVGESGRRRPQERRIEITSTYAGGSLEPLENYEDVVLGYEREQDVFVGFDARRLEHGGVTENASSFLDAEGLRLATTSSIVIIPRESGIFGLEYHAFFKPARVAEYLFNLDAINAGTYTGSGRFAARARPTRHPVLAVSDTHATGVVLEMDAPSRPRQVRRSVRSSDVQAYESGNHRRLARRKITPEAFEAIKRRCEENGRLGEKFVLDSERSRLLRVGRSDLAAKVRWTSQESVGAGFDIQSFEEDGTDRYLEVKSTESSGISFEMSRNEWAVANHLRAEYYIARVVNVRESPSLQLLRDPVLLEEQGHLSRDAAGWIIRLS